MKSGLSAIEGFASSFSTNDLVFDFCRVALPFTLLTPFESTAAGKETVRESSQISLILEYSDKGYVKMVVYNSFGIRNIFLMFFKTVDSFGILLIGNPNHY